MDGELRSWRPLVQTPQAARPTAPTDWTALREQADIQDLVHSYLRIEDARLRAAAVAAVRALGVHSPG